MGAGSETGRRSLAIAAVCCAICGLVLAASAMPMLATESPAGDFFDDPDERDPAAGAEATSGGGSGPGFESDASLALAAYADDLNSPIADGFLYGLAALFSIVDGDSSAAHAAEADADLELTADEDAEADLADSPVGGAFGDLLEPSAADDPDGTNEVDDPDANLESGDEFDVDEADGDGDAAGGFEDEGASGWDGDGDEADDGWTSDEHEGESGEFSDDAADGDGEEGERIDDGTDQRDGGDWSEGGADTDDTGGADTDGIDGADTDESAADADGNDPDDERDDATGATEDDGGDDSGLEGAIPESVDGATTALLVLAALVVAYFFYAREDPIGTLLAIPGRLVSLALTGLVACSHALERAIVTLRGLRSIAELPGFVLATVGDALRSAGTRFRTVASSVTPFADGDAAAADERADATVTARERIRRAFETVVDAAPMHAGRVTTATPADVARRARDAGAPAGPVETITDSFRDVEYGERDPEPYLERTAAAHDRLRAALETACAADRDGDADPADEVTDE